MAVTVSGLFGLSLEKMFINTAALDMEAETNKVALYTNSKAPNFDTDATYNTTAEVSGTGYTAGGKAYTTTEVTLSGGVLTYDCADPSWTTSTITSAVCAEYYAAAVASELFFLQYFGGAVSTVAGTFLITENASGLFTLDYTP